MLSSALYTPSKHKIQAVFNNADALATPLTLQTLDLYGMEAMEWHPATLTMQLQGDYEVKLSDAQLSRIYAGFTCITTDFFYQDVSKFIELCRVFAGHDFDLEVFSPAYLDEVIVATIEAYLLGPPDKKFPFHPEISGYVEHMMQVEGAMTPVFTLREFFENPPEFFPGEWDDDPEMFQSVYHVQKSKTQELLNIARDHLVLLLEQIRPLPLKNGSTDLVVQKLEKSISTLPKIETVAD